ncbi:hypothetical protein K9U39_09745 [Rhodoblastus acidophilus]|nr:hypothetical protein [Rhodoblastus acidophilus]
MTRWGAAGWVWAPSAPDNALEVEAVLDGKAIAKTFANLPRADLRDTGKGTGQYGFAMTFADEVGSDRAPVIRVTGPEGLVDLSDGKWPPVIGFVDIVTRSGADGWAWLPTLGEEVAEVEAFLDNKSIGHATADQIRSDRVAAGMGSGRLGFMLIFDQPVVGDKVPEFRVSTRGKTVSLPSLKEFAAHALPEARPAALAAEGAKSSTIATAPGDSAVNKGMVYPANDKIDSLFVAKAHLAAERAAEDRTTPLPARLN